MREITVILDSVRSAHNVGSILRTCDGAGIKRVFLTGFTPTPPNPKVSKTALGAENSLIIDYFKDINEAIYKLKSEGFLIVSVEQTKNSINYFNFHPKNLKIAFIVGHEVTGVSPEALEESDFCIELPMEGVKNSLNVSIATGIIIYHFKFNE